MAFAFALKAAPRMARAQRFGAALRSFSAKAPRVRTRPVLLTAHSPLSETDNAKFLEHLDTLNVDVMQCRQTVVGGHSTFSLIASLPLTLQISELNESIQQKLPDFHITGDEHPLLAPPPVDDEIEMLELIGLGPDRKGIAALFMAMLDTHGVLPRTLDFQCSDSGFRGVRMLQLRSHVIIPRKVDIEALQNAIKEFQERYGFVIQAEKADDGEQDESGEGEQDESEESLQERYRQVQQQMKQQPQPMAGHPGVRSQAPLMRPRSAAANQAPPEAYRR